MSHEVCEYNHEGFCTVEISGDFEEGYQCPKVSLKEEGAEGLPVCMAKPEDLIEVYEECDWCEGPGEDENHEFPPCPLADWDMCDHPFWKKDVVGEGEKP